MKRMSAVGSFVTFLCLFAAGHATAIEFQTIDALGLEYKTAIKVNASASFIADGTTTKASYTFFEATVTLNNKDDTAKNLVICTFGYSKKFDEKDEDDKPVAFRRTQINMTFQPNDKILGCMLSQDQDEMKHTRIGQMGCRQVSLGASQKGLAVTFVSGNKRTTIKKVDATLQVDQIGPVQDGQRNKEKVIAAGGAGAGGHPLVTRNPIGKETIRVKDALDLFYTRLLLSMDAEVKLDVDEATFNCNKCFGMGSTLGDPAATRTDFFLNLPSTAVRDQAKLKVANQYDTSKSILLAAGGRTQTPIELINDSGETVFVNIRPKLLELPSACTAQLFLPEPEPLSLPPRESKTATVEFDCGSDLPAGAAADVIFAMNGAGTGEELADYWIKARNPVMCDINLDGQVDVNDIDLIASYRSTPAFGPGDPFDVDGDGLVTVNDARICVNRCTNARCAP